MLGTAAAVGFAGSAHAFTVQSCGTGASGPSACGEFREHYRFHKELIAAIDVEFNKLHISPAEQRAILARAICPICGQPLIV
jgi:hypothetical protein